MSSPSVWGAQNLKIELLGLPRLDYFMVFHGGCLISKLSIFLYKSWNSINLFILVILNCWCFQNMLWLLRCLHHFGRGMILVCFIPRRIAESPRGLKMRHLVRVVQELERQAESEQLPTFQWSEKNILDCTPWLRSYTRYEFWRL